jgi:hypothetical protein
VSSLDRPDTVDVFGSADEVASRELRRRAFYIADSRFRVVEVGCVARLGGSSEGGGKAPAESSAAPPLTFTSLEA